MDVLWKKWREWLIKPTQMLGKRIADPSYFIQPKRHLGCPNVLAGGVMLFACLQLASIQGYRKKNVFVEFNIKG